MDKALLEKFKAGKCSPEEVRKILLWYQSEEAETSFSFELENYWNAEHDLPFVDKDKVYDLVNKEIGRKENEGIVNRAPVHRPIGSGKQLMFNSQAKGIVVFVLLLLSVSLFYFRTQLFGSQPRKAAIQWMTRKTAMGQKYTIQLPDGTQVKLNSGSLIHYPEMFSDSLRLVEFEGEGFFEVAKDSSKPFVIRSGNVSTMVLGTSFNMKTRTATESFELAVMTGSVKISYFQKGQSLEERFINPNQSAVLHHENSTFSIQGFDPSKVLAWINGTIIFENSSFREIVHTLENWYGVHIDTSSLDRKLPKGYTGIYKDKSLETVLEGISFVLDFNYEIKGKKVIIK